MTSVEETIDLLHKAVERIDVVFAPWGFQFEFGESGYSSPGAFANGHYRRGPTSIGLVYRRRWSLGGVGYVYESTEQFAYHRDRTRWCLGHNGLMRQLGHGDDCKLIMDSFVSSVGRNGEDPIEALMDDLRNYASPVLATECIEFVELIRNGSITHDLSW